MILLLFIINLCFAYDQDIVKQSVALSQAAYCVTDKWDCLTCNSNIELEYIIENSGSKAIQGYDYYSNSIFIAFRGSSNIHNWIENIQIMKISPYNNRNITVEKGFYKAYNNIKPTIFNNLQLLKNKYNTNKLLITGHSLGAAMSTLMTYDILTIFNEYTINYSINFGSPRVGNDNFVESYNSYNINNYRVTHDYDMVPHLPEEFLGYQHIANEIWYNEDNSEYKICDDLNNKEDDNCSNSCSPLHCTSTSDHLYYLNVTMGNDDCLSC